MHTALAEDLKFVLSTHNDSSRLPVTPSPGESDAPFWPLRASDNARGVHAGKGIK